MGPGATTQACDVEAEGCCNDAWAGATSSLPTAGWVMGLSLDVVKLPPGPTTWNGVAGTDLFGPLDAIISILSRKTRPPRISHHKIAFQRGGSLLRCLTQVRITRANKVTQFSTKLQRIQCPTEDVAFQRNDWFWGISRKRVTEQPTQSNSMQSSWNLNLHNCHSEVNQDQTPPIVLTITKSPKDITRKRVPKRGATQPPFFNRPWANSFNASLQILMSNDGKGNSSGSLWVKKAASLNNALRAYGSDFKHLQRCFSACLDCKSSTSWRILSWSSTKTQAPRKLTCSAFDVISPQTDGRFCGSLLNFRFTISMEVNGRINSHSNCNAFCCTARWVSGLEANETTHRSKPRSWSPLKISADLSATPWPSIPSNERVLCQSRAIRGRSLDSFLFFFCSSSSAFLFASNRASLSAFFLASASAASASATSPLYFCTAVALDEMPDALLGVLGSALTFAGVITGLTALDPDAAPPGFTTGSDSGTISTSWATFWCFTSAGLGKSISLSLVGPVFGWRSGLLNGDRDRFLVLGLGFGTWRTSVVITSLVGWSGSSECQYQPKRQLPGPTPGGGVEGGANGTGGGPLGSEGRNGGGPLGSEGRADADRIKTPCSSRPSNALA